MSAQSGDELHPLLVCRNVDVQSDKLCHLRTFVSEDVFWEEVRSVHVPQLNNLETRQREHQP